MNITLKTRSNVSYLLFMALMAFRGLTYWIDAAAPVPKVLIWGYAALVCYILGKVSSAAFSGEIQTMSAYRYIAHPAYTLYIFTDLAIFPFTEWTMANLGTLLLFDFFITLTSHYEERELIAKHGKAARDYLSRVLSVYRLTTRFK